MGSRAVVSIVHGHLPTGAWVAAAREEPPHTVAAQACGPCPLRFDGAWSAGISEAFAARPPTRREMATLRRWTCHTQASPCVGMRRVLAVGDGRGR